jgi:hypothetical protein
MGDIWIRTWEKTGSKPCRWLRVEHSREHVLVCFVLQEQNTWGWYFIKRFIWLMILMARESKQQGTDPGVGPLGCITHGEAEWKAAYAEGAKHMRWTHVYYNLLLRELTQSCKNYTNLPKRELGPTS